MKETNLAIQLSKDAVDFSTQNLDNSLKCIIIDKVEYKDYNFEILKQELNKLNFDMCDLENAPNPYSQMPLKNKLFIFSN